MVQNKQKIVQAFIEGLNEVRLCVENADDLAQEYKSKWIALNPDISGSKLSSQEVSEINKWVNDLNTLRKSSVSVLLKNIRVHSHGTKALG